MNCTMIMAPRQRKADADDLGSPSAGLGCVCRCGAAAAAGTAGVAVATGMGLPPARERSWPAAGTASAAGRPRLHNHRCGLGALAAHGRRLGAA